MSDEHEPSEKYKAKMQNFAKELGLAMEEVDRQKMSLRQLKKLIAHRKYSEQKLERRRKEKQKLKLKRAELKAQGFKVERATVTLMKDSSNKMPIAIDLSFNDYMTDKEIRRLMKQIHRCYSMNRRNSAPCQLFLTSCSTELQDKFDAVMPGFKNWDIICRTESHVEVFKDFKDRNSLVFLTSDSETKLPESEKLKETNGQFAYIIGGLIDHNAHKGLTRKLAGEQGIQHAKLPLDDHVSLSCSKVLTVNQVFELMLNTSTGMPWSDAFGQVVPQRKLHLNKPRSVTDNKEESDSIDDEDL
ncbi:tRNA methyltransferase 10 -like protein A [Halotydeus destructor]|nr:tRNA methyltransferase 10 -like protein A [Halotydeus destructor]